MHDEPTVTEESAMPVEPEEMPRAVQRSTGMGWRFFLTVLLVIMIAWVVIFPKIYLQNTIYYKSRKIATLQRQYRMLEAENRTLRSRVEAMRFKNQVLDTLFDVEAKLK